MSSRKNFLGALASGTSLAFAASDAASPPASALPPAARNASDPARAEALAMRRFDAKLTDEQLETIARGIDDNRRAGPLLSPHAAPLRNRDEPVTRFALPETQ